LNQNNFYKGGDSTVNRKYTITLPDGEIIYVGVDLHNKQWHITIRTFDLELFSASIAGTWEALRCLLARYTGHPIKVVYEAGYFGFWLHDLLQEYGVECIVTPPSLIPQQAGNRVKTDRLDSRKLALYLAKDLLKRVWVPSAQERAERQVARTRRQLVRDRVRVQARIKALLRCYGLPLPEHAGKWSHRFVENLSRVKFAHRWVAESFESLLEQYRFFSEQILRQTRLLKKLAETERYKERVKVLRSIPGVGLVVAMELLLELQSVERFRRAEELAAYVGLTPSQDSSAERVRMGHITRAGKRSLRGTLIEASWYLIGKDKAMRKKYERIKARAGAKRAIVAVARKLLLCTRRMLLDQQRYRTRQAA
jgi:transposase